MQITLIYFNHFGFFFLNLFMGKLFLRIKIKSHYKTQNLLNIVLFYTINMRKRYGRIYEDVWEIYLKQD